MTDAEERRRLARLRQLAVMDTEPEPVFDGLVRLAAAICGTPISLVSLVDERRQWFKANNGLDGVAQTDRDIAFCAHAIDADGIMEVPDATLDARFAGNPLVLGQPEIRFYAGAPITMPEGERIGTLCVIDRRPRQLTQQQREALKELAGVARAALLQREQREQAERQLLEANEHLRAGNFLLQTVLDSLPCGLSVFDANLDLVAHNRQFRDLLALPDSLFEGPVTTFESIIRHNAARGEYGDGPLEDTVRGIVDRARTPTLHNFQRTRPDGTTIEVRGAPMPGGGFVTTYVDVSASKKSEEALRSSEERLKRALEASRLALWDLDLATGRLYLSENWSEMMGGQRQPQVSTFEAMTQRVPPEDRDRIAAALAAVFKGTSPLYDMEHRVTTDDGRVIWIHSKGRVVRRDAQGRALRATGTNEDVTDRKLAQEELQRAIAINRGTLESTTDGIVVVNAEREIMLYNRQFQQIWGLADDDALRKSRTAGRAMVPQLKDPTGFLERIDALYADPHAVGFDLLELKDGRSIERYSRPMSLQDGSITGRVWSFRDVTERSIAEAAIIKAKQEAEANSQAKTEFLATVSHEIRTPLNGVMGIAKLLLAEHLTPQQRQYVRLIDASAQSLLTLINDLLDLGKIEAGKLELESVAFALEDVVGELSELYTLRASEKSLLFKRRVADDVPRWLVGDPHRLRQVLGNLLTNALKFTHSGEVELTVATVRREGERARLRFSVRDTGIGIAPDVQARLFDRFIQADSSTTRQYGGTGLGLAIVKELSERMGGSVSVTSVPGDGSVFSCEIEFGIAQPRETRQAPRDVVAPARHARPDAILVAEDNATNRIVAQGMLAHMGFPNVTMAHDGQEAVAAALKGGYAAILMDCHMPVLDGFAATEQLRAAGCRIPIIALTASATAADRERCLRVGMDDYLSKPLDAVRLAHVLDQWVPDRPWAETGPATDSMAAPHEPAIFERSAALQRLGGETELLQLVIESFLKETPAAIEQLEHALQASQQEVVHRRLHTLAGSSATVGAALVHREARAMEHEAAAGNLDAVAAKLPVLLELISQYRDHVGARAP